MDRTIKTFRTTSCSLYINILTGLFIAICLSGCTSQSSYPSKPVILICPWSPGGGTDRVSRQVAAQLKNELGVPVNVVNATGGGGVTGHTRGALARPDGYTITLATVELNMLHWRGLTDLSHHDYEPLALLNRDDAAVFVRQDAPWMTINELEDAIRNKPGKLKASGTASGGIWHVALAGWLASRDMQADAVTWISINGSAPSLQELMADGLDLVCCSVPEAQSLVEGGLIRCLGVMSDTRLSSAMDIPTFCEQEIDWKMGNWRGIVFPKGVPEDRVAHMREAILRVARSEEFAQYMDASGFNLSVAGPEEFGELLKEMDDSFGTIMTSPAFARIGQSQLGPMVFPGFALGIGLTVLIGLFFQGQLKLQDGSLPLAPSQIMRLSWSPAGIVFFIIASEITGFILAAGVMLLGLLLVLRVKVLLAIGLTVVLVPGLYHLFAVYLGVPLPWGWIGW